ncbi:MBL fold metallo-hydrolase [Billgrantia azerbaijanica]|nr:MBL fold metallo-hydrolase [Halomonas azerbaijanica]
MNVTAIVKPTQYAAKRVTSAWTVLPAWLPVPGMGVLPVNSFLLKGSEPMLVDTGLAALGDEYLDSLASEIDPEDLGWIWLSHMDPDHVGNLGRVLERAPNARIVTNFLGAGKMGLAGLDLSRVSILEPGMAFEAGGHRLMPLRPPYYDAPETIGFFDERERVLFAADSFGALLQHAVEETCEVGGEALREGLVNWSSIDAPWLSRVDRAGLGRTLRAIERLDPDILLSGHLPVARQGVETLTRIIADAYVHGVTPANDAFSLEQLAATMERTRAAMSNTI